MVRLMRQNIEEPQGDLTIEEVFPNCVTVAYIPPTEKLERANLEHKNPESHKKEVLYICGQDDFITIFPINTLPEHESFLESKYGQIKRITLADFGFKTPETISEVLQILERLPSGFIKDYEYGLGLLKDLRFIILAVEDISETQELVISRKDATSISQEAEAVTINFNDFDTIRKKLNRITNNTRAAAQIIKRDAAHNLLATFLNDPNNYQQKTTPQKNKVLSEMISSNKAGANQLSISDQNNLIELVEANTRKLSEEQPEKLIKLRNNIELVTLEELISRFEEMIGKKLSESHWQKLFNDNPFILNQAFGYPVIKVQDQAHVGGKKISGSGGKITDFLFKHGISNNAAIFEIKDPSFSLLNKSPYRDGIYPPSAKLSGAINQALDQKNKFQKEISNIKDNSRIHNLESYSVPCVLIAGRTPQDLDQQKSFELFRGNSKNVSVITFDELLEKLKQIHEFLQGAV